MKLSDSKITISAIANKEKGTIELTFAESIEDSIYKTTKNTINTYDDFIRNNLIELGWTPPDKSTITKLNRYENALNRIKNMAPQVHLETCIQIAKSALNGKE